ncbi:MAG: ATP-dependent RecD-like DNA helicase [Oscillospiraceae bacterium]|nr:ATP-dependent RecD-like DNA helicase [Oscillospiraceae bacterium]
MSRLIINAVIENIVYSNPDNGYVICEVDSKAEGQFYAVGYMPGISEGENAELTGEWVTHPEYGEQFKVELYRTVMPSDEQAIIKYLGSGVIKGVREATAKKLFDEFGNDVFNVIAAEPERLAKLKGISKDKAMMISQSFNEQRAVQNIIMFLQQYNISPGTAVKIHRILGANAVEKIKQNPYSLSNSIEGISFRTADNIASSMGLPKNNPVRIESGIKYFLREAGYSNGNVYLPKSLLIEHVTYELNVNEIEVLNALSELLAARDIIIDNIENTDACFLYGFYHDESYIARRLTAMGNSEGKYTMTEEEAEIEIDSFEREQGIKLAPEQRDAVVTALSGNCMILTGGPGTGKTTTINTVIRLMEKLKLKVALAAPTGRAAKRMSQISGREAKTIHRLLCAQRSGDGHVFSYDEEHPLSADVVILDEVSMVDTQLMASFLRAVKPGGKVIFSGDSDQLPSVGPGNVLYDMIESKTIPVIKLTRIFRQSRESLIILNAHKINRGEVPELRDHTKDFFFMRRSTPEKAVETVLELYKRRLPDTYSLNPINDIQVLTPMKKGVAGTVELNRSLQRVINPAASGRQEYKYGKTIFREGDKVMQTRNNYDMEYTDNDGEKGSGIYNGDMGIINSIHQSEKYMLITFDEDKTVEYPFASLDELDLAYAITVHKSQGSEFPFVVIPVCSYIPMLMSRNLFYTAITRAKRMVILVGSERTIINMTNNNSYTKRFTGLNERLIEMKKGNSENG